MRVRFLSAAVAALALGAAPARAEADPPPVVAFTAAAVDDTPDPPPIVRRVADLECRVAALEGKAGAARPAAAVPPAVIVARCGCAPGACPTPGFCGGAGCSCGPPTAPGVAGAAPFALSPCGPGGCPAPTGTPARLAATPPTAPTFSGVTYPAGTFMRASGAGSGGGIEGGCASGNCPAPTRGVFFRR